jgi:hypothetical protein
MAGGATPYEWTRPGEVEVEVAERHRRMQSGSVGMAIAVVLSGANAGAAVVRDVRAIPAASATRVIVEVEGEFTWRTHASADGGTVFVQIDDATIGDDAPRMVPVSDGRVDGVILGDADPGVRVAVDIAGRVAPRLDATTDGSRLVLTFFDGPDRVASAPASSASTLRRDPTPPGSPGPAMGIARRGKLPSGASPR